MLFKMVRAVIYMLFVVLLLVGCTSPAKNGVAGECNGSAPYAYLVVEVFPNATSPVDGEMRIDSFLLTDGCNVYTPDVSFSLPCALWGGSSFLPIAPRPLRRLGYRIDGISSFENLQLEVYCSCFYDSEAGCGFVEVVQRLSLHDVGYLPFAGIFECCSLEYGATLPFLLNCLCISVPHRRFFFI